jgi:hypothetical protein
MECLCFPNWVRRAFHLAAYSVVVFLSACGSPVPDSLELTVAGLKRKTIPDDAREIAFSGLKRDPSRVVATWELETGTGWESYRHKIASQLVDFEAKPTSPSEIVFTKVLPGDIHALRIEQVQSGPPLRVRAIFEAHPD